MPRHFLLVALFTLAFAPRPARAQSSPPEGGARADSARDALAEELENYLRELEGLPPEGDPFGEGRATDLVVLSTSDVRGEVAPCG